mmetsp:Transcript_44923/g.119091  ORF Transcript_44923/g.119091 Transcript_44923/m.119091 type:complete len:205 (-) Transcript_44923:39-653(-)
MYWRRKEVPIHSSNGRRICPSSRGPPLKPLNCLIFHVNVTRCRGGHIWIGAHGPRGYLWRTFLVQRVIGNFGHRVHGAVGGSRGILCRSLLSGNLCLLLCLSSRHFGGHRSRPCICGFLRRLRGSRCCFLSRNLACSRLSLSGRRFRRRICGCLRSPSVRSVLSSLPGSCLSQLLGMFCGLGSSVGQGCLLRCFRCCCVSRFFS